MNTVEGEWFRLCHSIRQNQYVTYWLASPAHTTKFTCEARKWILSRSAKSYTTLSTNPLYMKVADPRIDPELVMPEGF